MQSKSTQQESKFKAKHINATRKQIQCKANQRNATQGSATKRNRMPGTEAEQNDRTE
jgi:hypothetical protein